VCVEPGPHVPGDACQRVMVGGESGHDGDLIAPLQSEDCGARVEGELARCRTNQIGFPGGMCTATCAKEGARLGSGVCMRIPHQGFEAACLREGVALESCLLEAGNSVLEVMRACSRTEGCRDDFVCARVPGLPIEQGACVPPYFLFQARVDGPPLDR
jgi:hypothetical protein